MSEVLFIELSGTDAGGGMEVREREEKSFHPGMCTLVGYSMHAKQSWASAVTPWTGYMYSWS